MIWHDEFEGLALDTSKWAPAEEGQRKGGWWSPKAIALDGEGHLVIKTSKEGGRYVDGCVYTQGKFEHTFGYYVARIKTPRQPGHWSGFWMMSPGVFNIGDEGKDGSEIDIATFTGRGDLVQHSLHWDGYDKNHKTEAKPVTVPGIMEATIHTVFGGPQMNMSSMWMGVRPGGPRRVGYHRCLSTS